MPAGQSELPMPAPNTTCFVQAGKEKGRSSVQPETDNAVDAKAKQAEEQPKTFEYKKLFEQAKAEEEKKAAEEAKAAAEAEK